MERSTALPHHVPNRARFALPALFAMCKKSYNRAIGRSSQQQRLAAVDMHGGRKRLLRTRANNEPPRRFNDESRQSHSMYC